MHSPTHPGRHPSAAPHANIPLWLLHPPYERYEPVAVARWPEPHVAPGTVLVVQPAGTPADCRALPDFLPALRARFPGLPVVLRVDGSRGSGDVMRCAHRAGRLMVRTVLVDGENIQETLRHALTDRSHLGQDVAEWLYMRGLRLSPALLDVLQQILVLAPAYDTISELMADIHEPIKHARVRFQKKRIPSPAGWMRMIHALHAALALQSEPSRSLLHVALSLDYVDHSALSRQIFRCFGERPSAIRDTLGWEWLVERWAVRNKLAFGQPRQALPDGWLRPGGTPPLRLLEAVPDAPRAVYAAAG